MPCFMQCILSFLGRVLLCTIFFMSAVGNKIPNFDTVAGTMGDAGIPAPRAMLIGAIAFLVVGSISVVLGWVARVGAFLLLIFLILASVYFHNFWDLGEPSRTEQMVQFLKNLGLMGAMVFIMGNGPGHCSIDAWRAGRRIAAAPAQQPVTV